uniref:Methyltransferase FkbM domain-containing protein n=1 Tax=Odontella aurita TaxID=265563 RepID=A0A7S4JSV5_9STRA|mmetsp:Transcript_52781/g.158011  ORF Transcript_52781/g.158011 Transcript_52781/m.158011 type:complete len:266 (+) Transcript_52781:263-1060(+)
MKEQMRLPCNYIHDGWYIEDSNEVLNQVYQSLITMNDDDIPVMIECGGHDGITKSISLKSSICLNMNTLLIEGSPKNFNVLHQTRKYDFTVNAALCDGDYVEMVDNSKNSGQTRVASNGEDLSGNNIFSSKIKCTSIDNELDKLRDTLPESQRDKLKLVFLVLDVEGHEPVAIKGIKRYKPQKVMMEWKHLKSEDQTLVNDWAGQHGLVVRGNDGWHDDRRWDYDASMLDKPKHMKKLFYGARKKHPKATWKTSEVTEAYMFYGE